MSENIITIKILRKFLNEVPPECDHYELINGEVLTLPGEEGEETFFVRSDKPIVQMQIDDEDKAFCMFHQSEEELESILAQMEGNGDIEGTE